MDYQLESFLKKMEEFGKSNDELHAEKELRMRNISPTTGEFISMLIKISHAERVLEIGTSNGYSTLWIADALQNGKVTTIEFLETKVRMAEENFKHSGLASRIEQVQGDAGIFLKNAESGAYDFILLDSDRKEYVSWWDDLKRIMMPGGLLIVDNVVSHKSELTEFIQLVRETTACESTVLAFDSGVMLVKFH